MPNQSEPRELTPSRGLFRQGTLCCAILTSCAFLTGCYEHVVSVKGGPYNGMIYKSNLDDPSEQSSNAAQMRERANADYQKQVKELQKPRRTERAEP